VRPMACLSMCLLYCTEGWGLSGVRKPKTPCKAQPAASTFGGASRGPRGPCVLGACAPPCAGACCGGSGPRRAQAPAGNHLPLPHLSPLPLHHHQPTASRPWCGARRGS
jgi:hypothetical protein